MDHILRLQRWCCPGSIPHQSPTQTPLVSDHHQCLVSCLVALQHLIFTHIPKALPKHILLFCCGSSTGGCTLIYLWFSDDILASYADGSELNKDQKSLPPRVYFVLQFEAFLFLFEELKN